MSLDNLRLKKITLEFKSQKEMWQIIAEWNKSKVEEIGLKIIIQHLALKDCPPVKTTQLFFCDFSACPMMC